MIKSMSDKIRSDAAQRRGKALPNLATVPIYKILAVQAYAHYALTDGEIQTLSEIVAVDLLSAMLDNMLTGPSRRRSTTRRSTRRPRRSGNSRSRPLAAPSSASVTSGLNNSCR